MILVFLCLCGLPLTRYHRGVGCELTKARLGGLQKLHNVVYLKRVVVVVSL